MLYHHIAERDLAVTGQRHSISSLHAEHSGAMALRCMIKSIVAVHAVLHAFFGNRRRRPK
jgi:hypothetical protein